MGRRFGQTLIAFGPFSHSSKQIVLAPFWAVLSQTQRGFRIFTCHGYDSHEEVVGSVFGLGESVDRVLSRVNKFDLGRPGPINKVGLKAVVGGNEITSPLHFRN